MPGGRLWLDRALESVRRQIVRHPEKLEIVVGLDAGAALPERVLAEYPGLIAVNARADGSGGQAAALNAALAAISGDYVAFLEDDDWWECQHLELAIDALGSFDFISSSQRLVDPMGGHIGVAGYATPSSWVMRRKLMELVGQFNEDYRFHLDSEWLGRLNGLVERRGHFIESNGGVSGDFLAGRQDLAAVMRNSKPAAVSLLRAPGCYTQVVRTQNPEGGIASILGNGESMKRSRLERALLMQRFGMNTW